MKRYEKSIKEIIFRHLTDDKWWVFLFGSRTAQINSQRADYDVGLFSQNSSLPLLVMSKIEGELEESNIPYIVDIVDFSKVDDNFKKVAGRKVILWKKPKGQSPPEWMHLVEH